MGRRYPTPGTRKRKMLRDAVILLGALALLLLALDFPMLTANQALRATETQHFFGHGQVLTQWDNPRPPNTARGLYDRYYITRREGWYAQCGVNRNGLFWRTGLLDAVENDPALALVPLIPELGRNHGFLLVVSNHPDIAAVEIAFPAADPGSPEANGRGYVLVTARSDQPVEGCFVIPYTAPGGFSVHLSALRLRGYDRTGSLIYQRTSPMDWTDEFGF